MQFNLQTDGSYRISLNQKDMTNEDLYEVRACLQHPKILAMKVREEPNVGAMQNSINENTCVEK